MASPIFPSLKLGSFIDQDPSELDAVPVNDDDSGEQVAHITAPKGTLSQPATIAPRSVTPQMLAAAMNPPAQQPAAPGPGAPAPQQDAVGAALSGLSPDLSDAALKAQLAGGRRLQGVDEQMKAANHLGAALGGIGRGFVGKADDTLNDDSIKNDMNGAADIQTRVANEGKLSDLAKQQMAIKTAQAQEDSSSPISGLYRDVVNQMGLKVNNLDSLSASDISGALGPIEKYLSGQQIAQLRAMMAQQNRDARNDALKSKLDNQQYKNVESAQNALEKDTNYTAAKAGLATADRADELLADASTNPQSANALPALLTKLTIGGSRLPQSLVTSMGGSKAVGDKLEQLYDTAKSGTISPENAAFAKQLVSQSRNSYASQASKTALDRAKQFGNRNKMETGDAYYALTGDDMPANLSTAPAGSGAAPSNSGYIPTPQEAAQELAKRQAAKAQGQ